MATASVDLVGAGPNAGTIAVTSSWANCTGIDSVTIIVYSETAGGVANLPVAKTLHSPPALNATGSWPTTVTGMTTGHVVTKVEVRVYPQPAPGGGGQLLVAIAAGEKANIRVTVP